MSKPVSIYLIAAARRIWRWHPSRRWIKDQAREGKKYRCAECKKLVIKIQIDHIEPVGKGPRDWNGWDAYYRKLFCDTSNLRALCTICHKAKTKKEKKEGAYKEKIIHECRCAYTTPYVCYFCRTKSSGEIL